LVKDNQLAIGQYIAAIGKWWWLIVTAVLVASASSYVAVSRAPRTYEATTTVLVGQGLEKANPTYEDFAISQQLAQTYINIVRRQPILEGAATALDLDYVPWSGNVSGRIVPGTQLVEISVRDSSPDRARALADEIAQQLILQTPTDSAVDRGRWGFVQEQMVNLENNIRATEAEILEEQAKLDAATSARTIQQYQGNVAALQQKLASYQAGYASLLQAMQQERTNIISVIEPATASSTPISPRVAETIMVAAAIGLGLAVGGALLIEFLDDTVKTPADLARVTDLTLLGEVSRIGDVESNGSLVVRRAPQSLVGESFRAVRINMQFASLDRAVRTLMVTSPDAGEGKSLIAANLALSIAQGGSSVVLVDADMRRPTQHELFGLSNGRGLSRALLELGPDLSAYSQQVQLYDREAGKPGAGAAEDGRPLPGARSGELRVITSGPVPPNPADLLASERMLALIKFLESQADVVLVDAPPVMVVTDAVALSTRVDGVLLVIDAGRTRRARTQNTVERLRHVSARLLGVVLNRVPSSRGGYYSYSRYHYAAPDGRGGKSQPGAKSATWFRNLRQAVEPVPAAQQRGVRSLDQWLGEFGGPEAGRLEPGRPPQGDQQESWDEQDSTRTQQVFLGDYLKQESDAGGVEDIKRVQQIFLGDYLKQVSDAGGEEDIKRTQRVSLTDPLPPELDAGSKESVAPIRQVSAEDDLVPESDEERTKEVEETLPADSAPELSPEQEIEDEQTDDEDDTRMVSLDEYLATELEGASEQEGQTKPPVEAT
jgi:non-specific protein-tyrosine kinase